MHPLRVIIADDEPLARERLRALLANEPDVMVVGEAADGTAAVELVQDLRPEVAFLDIQMSGADGLQVAVRLRAGHRVAVVFTTGHERFAREAFDVGAADYLLKPFDGDRLRAALARARVQLGQPDAGAAEARPAERIAFRTGGRIVFVRLRDLAYVEAQNNHVILHLTGERLVLRDTLAAIEERLGARQFARVNRSAIVQLDQVRELQPGAAGDGTVVLRDGTRLPVSPQLRARLERALGGGS